MKIKITSSRGHHEADVMEPEVGKALFDKLSGRSINPLPEEMKAILPENFQELQGLWKEGKLGYVPASVEEGNSDDAAVMTEWDLYRNRDFKRIYRTMSQPAFIFDGRNILAHRRLFDIGFNVYPIGKPPLTHF